MIDSDGVAAGSWMRVGDANPDAVTSALSKGPAAVAVRRRQRLAPSAGVDPPTLTYDRQDPLRVHRHAARRRGHGRRDTNDAGSATLEVLRDPQSRRRTQHLAVAGHDGRAGKHRAVKHQARGLELLPSGQAHTAGRNSARATGRHAGLGRRAASAGKSRNHDPPKAKRDPRRPVETTSAPHSSRHDCPTSLQGAITVKLIPDPLLLQCRRLSTDRPAAALLSRLLTGEVLAGRRAHGLSDGRRVARRRNYDRRVVLVRCRVGCCGSRSTLVLCPRCLAA